MSSEEANTGFVKACGAAQIRWEADMLLDEFGDASVDYLAQGLLDRAEAYDGGVDVAHAIAAELQRRSAADVRFWSSAELHLVQPCSLDEVSGARRSEPGHAGTAS